MFIIETKKNPKNLACHSLRFYLNSSLFLGSNHHSCALQRNLHVFQRKPDDTVPCLKSRFLIQTVKMIVKTGSKPPSSWMQISTIFTRSVIVLVFCAEFHSIVTRKSPTKKFFFNSHDFNTYWILVYFQSFEWFDISPAFPLYPPTTILYFSDSLPTENLEYLA